MFNIIRTIAFLVLLICLGLSSSHPVEAQPNEPAYYLNQYRLALSGLSNPSAAYTRVLAIWVHLQEYSHTSFPVYPSQIFTAGMSTPGGIYLDVSIAADPNTSVTRFFLAHEWGHMVHGDPLNGLIVGPYQVPFANNNAVEDAADEYAAKFMQYWGYDIRPALNFLCDSPDGGPQDTHSSGTERAANLAKAYGYESWIPACIDSSDEQALLVKEIKAIANATLHRFAHSRKISVGGIQTHRLAIPVTVDGRDGYCRADDLDEVSCEILLADDSSQIDDATSDFDLLTSAIAEALPNWKQTNKEDDDTSVDDMHRWWRVVADPDSGKIEAALVTSSRSNKQYIRLVFQRPKPPE